MIIQPPEDAGQVNGARVSRDIGNRLLLVLPPDVLGGLLGQLEPVELVRGEVLAQVGAPVDHVFFVNRGLVSLVRAMGDGRSADIATVGIEGIADPCTLLGMDHAILDAVVHVPGDAFRLPRQSLMKLMEQSVSARQLLEFYMQWLVDQMAQTSVCNRLHSLEQRCARWLLTAHDNARADRFPLTQDYLALMLGAQRSSVAEITAGFRQAGHVEYRAGHMHIRRRTGLKQAACECYQVLRTQLASFLP